MKRLVAVVSVVVSAVALSAAPAASQTGESTTTVAEPTTTVAEPTTTTTTLPEAPTTTVEVSPAPTSTTIPQVDRPGEHVTAGQLSLGASFREQTAASCNVSGSVAGGEMNIIKDEAGNIGVVYGKSDLGAGQAGVVMVALGPLPLAIGAFRTTGTCNQDVVGIGAYEGSPTSAKLSSVGYGLYPQDYANLVEIELQVSATEPTASLNLQSAYDFLAAPREAAQ
ncbi:MAG: hypothetical protein IT195_12300 [Microthrixaceae bacterium]|nr:hypothetical protein [Microthrixaceae bacterium]